MAPQAPADWNTHDQINEHKLATSVINNHADDGNMVFDESELSCLQRFTTNVASRDDILREHDWIDESGQLTMQKDGSLARYLMARHGTEDPALDERDIQLLKEWFEQGMPSGQSVVR